MEAARLGGFFHVWRWVERSASDRDMCNCFSAAVGELILRLLSARKSPSAFLSGNVIESGSLLGGFFTMCFADMLQFKP